MKNLAYPILTDVLEVISAANESQDCQLVRQKALDALFHTISASGAIFFLPDGNGQLTFTILKNLEKSYCDYYKTYFYKFDPLQLSRRRRKIRGANRLQNTISYDAFQPTEYYNDFLKPQHIHHKLIVNLVAEKELYGRIVLTRPRQSECFASNEIRAARAISPYLAHALAHNDLRRKIKLKGNILNFIEKQSSTGVILLDESLQIVYRNQKAEEVLCKLQGSAPASNIHSGLMPSQLFRDCLELRAGLRSCPRGGIKVPRHRVLKGSDHTRFSIISKVLDQEYDWEGSRLLMVSIEEESPLGIDPQYLMDKFNLSKRETEVVAHLVTGLKNAQIAQKLFVSEVTIKKHLQNIYEKAGVSSRTALINRVLTA